MIKLFDEFINEGKQVGLIYRVIDKEQFETLLDKDVIGGFREKTSFSRNSMYDWVVGNEPINGDFVFQLEVDGDKISNNYKIHPIDNGKGWVRDEYEEVVDKHIRNAGKYIKRIIVIIERKYYNKNIYDKREYQPYGGSVWKDLSINLFRYLKKYPNIKIVVKDNHQDILFNVHTDNDFLEAVGLKNRLEENLFENLLGIYKNKKRIYKTFCDDLFQWTEKNKKNIFLEFTTEVDYEGSPLKFEVVNGEEYEKRSKEQGDPYYGDWLYGSGEIESTLTDKHNNYVLIDLFRDKKNSISVRINYGDNTKKDLSFYRSLIKKYTTKNIIEVNIIENMNNYYERLNQRELEEAELVY